MKFLVYLGLMLVLGACSNSSLERNSSWAIDQNVNVYLVFPADLRMDEALHQSLTGIFQRYYPKTFAGLYREALPQSFVSAKRAGVDYLVFPRIIERESPVNVRRFLKKEVNLLDIKPSRLDMDIMIYAVNGEHLVDQLQFTSTGGLATLDETVLLWEPLDAYLRQLSQYGQNHY